MMVWISSAAYRNGSTPKDAVSNAVMTRLLGLNVEGTPGMTLLKIHRQFMAKTNEMNGRIS